MDFKEQKRLLEESVKYKYFKAIEKAIFYYAQKQDEDKRFALLEFYKKLSSIKYRIRTTPIDDEKQAMAALSNLQSQIKEVLHDFRSLVKNDLGRFSSDWMVYRDVLQF